MRVFGTGFGNVEFRVYGYGIKVEACGTGFGVRCSGLVVQDLGVRTQNSRLRD